MKLISIIVPVYNVELYIKKCIDSIIDQTYRDLQIILIDDGSTDKSGVICDEYAESDKRIQVLHQEHKGAAEARNAGLCIAEGGYIGFVDSDDWCEPQMFSEMIKAMQDNDADAVRCNLYCVQGDVRRRFIPNIAKMSKVNGRDAVIDITYHTKNSGFGGMVWNTLVKAEIVNHPKRLLFNPAFLVGEDSDWLRRYMLRAETVLLLPDCYYNYNRDNVSSVTRNLSYSDMISNADNAIRFLTENHFPEKVIQYRKKLRERDLIQKEISEYVTNKGTHTPVIDKISVIKENLDLLMNERRVLGFIKISIVLWMIQLQMSPKLVGKIWGLHRRKR